MLCLCNVHPIIYSGANSHVYGSSIDAEATLTITDETPTEAEFVYSPLNSRVLQGGFITRVEAAGTGDVALDIMVSLAQTLRYSKSSLFSTPGIQQEYTVPPRYRNILFPRDTGIYCSPERVQEYIYHIPTRNIIHLDTLYTRGRYYG